MVRYAQCWEDADVLLKGLDIHPGDTCLSIASAGDNTLALLARDPGRVIAIDYSSEQLACLELRVCAYRNLKHAELLELMGSAPSERRETLYRRCRADLSMESRRFWDARSKAIACGICHAGKFERYLEVFRNFILPLAHNRAMTDKLLNSRTLSQREHFYANSWDNWRWRLIFRVFFSRFFMARLGRDPCFFKYAHGAVAEQLLSRTRVALSTQDLAGNPYLQWICSGRHLTALPFALRPENFEAIRSRLDRLEWHCCQLEDYLEEVPANSIDRFNLSDVFEYMSPQQYEFALTRLVRAGRRGGRLIYWNLFADRHRPPTLAAHLQPVTPLAQHLRRLDKTFFYSDLVIEEMTKA